MSVRQQHHKLVTAEPIRAVPGAKVLPQCAGEGLQVLVAAMVSVGVIGRFEAVQIE